MKVLHVTRQFYPSVGGIETVIWHLSRHLKAAGYHVQVATLDRVFGERTRLARQEEVDGIMVRRFPFVGPRQYAVAPGILGDIREYDLVHVHSGDFLLDYVAWTKAIHGKPIVFSTHGLYFHTEFARAFKKIYFHTMTRLTLGRVSTITCDSDQDFQLISRIAPVKKLYLIPNGIEYDKLASFDIDNRDPDLLISIGRLTANKRYDRMLRAFAQVVRRNSHAKLIIIGPDWGVLSSLKDLASELGIARSVEFAEQVTENELLGFLKRAKVCLSASQYESFGVTLLESMAAGCISVFQPLPAFRQLMSDGVEGFYADFDKTERAVEVISRSMAIGPQEQKNIVRRARANAAKFSWEKVSRRFRDVYSKVVA